MNRPSSTGARIRTLVKEETTLQVVGVINKYAGSWNRKHRYVYHVRLFAGQLCTGKDLMHTG